jgi:phosphoglycolate phosphatase
LPLGHARVLQWKNMPITSAKPIQAFIFDLDGTLIDSKMDLVNSVNAMLREIGRNELPTETIARYIGHGAPQLIASTLGPDSSETDRKAALAIFLAHYEKHNLDATRAYPGVQEALASLTEHRMAVLTNKPLGMTVQILEGLGLAKFFSAVYGGDSFEKKKPDPLGALSILKEFSTQPEHAAMIGDSDVDIQTARNAKMLAVAVTYGFGNYDRRANPADLYVDRLTELVTFLPMQHS